MSITIKTNNQPRPLLSWDELTPLEQASYDWIIESDDGVDGFEFFRYKGYCYNTSDFMRVDKHSPFHALGWEGYQGDSFFSGVLIKYTPCNDGIICATYYS